MSEVKNSSHKAWAHFRFAMVGPLLASPPEVGQLRQRLRELAQNKWRHPLDPHRTIHVSLPTLQRWYYAARNADDPLAALTTAHRQDRGQTRRVHPDVFKALEAQYRQYPSWSTQLHYDNLKASCEGSRAPSYSTVRRLMKRQGWLRLPKPRRATPGAQQAEQRLAQREVRSYEVSHVDGLWHLDFHHGSMRIPTPAGQWVTPKLLCIMDDRSRIVCHIQWYLHETTENLVHGVQQALQKCGLPRALMTDNGAAMTAEEFTRGLADLSILWEPTLPYSPYQNGKQETFWAILEGRLMAMLAGKTLSLSELNEWTHLWVQRDYQHKAHRELGQSPMARRLQDKSVGRPCPTGQTLTHAFRRLTARKQRRSDGTISLAGQRFEVPNAYRHVEKLFIRYATWDLRSVTLVHPETQAAIATLWPLDKQRNAQDVRRHLVPTPPATPTHNTDQNALPPLLEKIRREHRASGLPLAYLPKDECV